MASNTNILKQNATHKAVKVGDKIQIWLKGIEFEDLVIPDERLYSINVENEDDLFAIFERLDEDNRVNIAEFMDSMK